MSEKKSAVTPQRYASGLTYRDYLAQVKVNKERFEQYYETAKLTGDDKAFFQKASQSTNGIGKMLVIGEDWCPDAFRGIPLAARIAEVAGVEMRIFPRDTNPDIMNEFLKEGKFMSIPVVVFYTPDLEYICHWTERPEAANRERAQIEEAIRKEKPGATDQEIRTLVGERTRERYPAWQQESVREIRVILSDRLGV